MLRAAAAFLLLFCAPAAAMVGDAAPVGANGLGRQVVLLVGSNGSYCSGAVLARQLVLTTAHCVPPDAGYKLVEYDDAHQPMLKDIAVIARHPQYSPAAMAAHRATADLALLKLAAPMAASHVPVAIGMPRQKVKPGDPFIVAGYGVARDGDVRSGGALRRATLVATGRPGNLQIRLVDPAARGERAGRGACNGDSGAPVWQQAGDKLVTIGVVSWTTGPNMTLGCGGITGVTPLELYNGWIVETAKKLGAALPSSLSP